MAAMTPPPTTTCSALTNTMARRAEGPLLVQRVLRFLSDAGGDRRPSVPLPGSDGVRLPPGVRSVGCLALACPSLAMSLLDDTRHPIWRAWRRRMRPTNVPLRLCSSSVYQLYKRENPGTSNAIVPLHEYLSLAAIVVERKPSNGRRDRSSATLHSRESRAAQQNRAWARRSRALAGWYRQLEHGR